MKVETVKRELARAVIQGIHGPSLRLADSAQAELHSAIRAGFCALDCVERSRLTRRYIKGIATALGHQLVNASRHAKSRRKGKLVVRRSLLRKTVETLGTGLLACDHGEVPMNISPLREDDGDLPPSLGITEAPLLGEPQCLERRFIVHGNLVASALLEAGRDACTFIWPLGDEARISDVLETFLSEVAASSSTKTEQKVEGCCSDKYFEIVFPADASPKQILDALSDKICTSEGCLELLEVSSSGAVLELLINDVTKNPSRLALVLNRVPAIPVMRFFTVFHRDEAVRNRYLNTSSPPAAMARDASMIFAPLPFIASKGTD